MQIDEVLVRHAELGGEPLKIGHRRFVQTNGNGLLEAAAIVIPLSVHRGEIILRSHWSSPIVRGLLSSGFYGFHCREDPPLLKRKSHISYYGHYD
jgi:hypothetical protein